MGTFRLSEIAAIELPFGLRIERDILFAGDFPLSVWARAARASGGIRAAETMLYRAARAETEGS